MPIERVDVMLASINPTLDYTYFITLHHQKNREMGLEKVKMVSFVVIMINFSQVKTNIFHLFIVFDDKLRCITKLKSYKTCHGKCDIMCVKSA